MFGKFIKDLFNQTTAPEHEALGALLNDKDERDILLDSFQPTDIEIPESYFTDISKLNVYDQGKFGTCVAHVFATIKQYNEYKDTGSIIDFSRRFIYHFGRLISGMLDSDAEGLSPRVAVKSLVDIGASESKLWPEVSTTHSDYSIPSPSPLSRENALDYRVKGYAFGGEGDDAIKRAIMNNGIVGVSIPVDRFAFDRRTGKISKPNILNFSGRHYMVVYGFSGDIFYVKNTWGKLWGKSGNGYFRFSDYAGFIRDVVAITDIPQKIIEEAKNKKYIFTETVRFGSRGEAVKQLQKKLNELSFFFGKQDGIFGNETLRAVKAFQVANSLVSDGIVGPKSNAILNGMNPSKKLSLVDALIQIESQGNDNAIGDKHLTDKAFGCLQIRKPCVQDVNTIFGTNYTAEQMLGNRQLSLWVFARYMEIYATERKLGRPVTDEDRARIWNGGPTGYKRDSTIPYWEKVEKLLNK